MSALDGTAFTATVNIPVVVIHKGTLDDVQVYAELALRARDGSIQVSVRYLARVMGWSSAGRVTRSIAHLVDLGVLERASPGRWFADTRGAATIYRLPCGQPGVPRAPQRAPRALHSARTAARSPARKEPLRGSPPGPSKNGTAAPCPRCDGTGWVMIDPDDRRSLVTPCDCSPNRAPLLGRSSGS